MCACVRERQTYRYADKQRDDRDGRSEGRKVGATDRAAGDRICVYRDRWSKILLSTERNRYKRTDVKIDRKTSGHIKRRTERQTTSV